MDDHAVGRVGKQATVLPRETEERLAKWIRDCRDSNVAPTARFVRLEARRAAAEAGVAFKGKGGIPGQSWWAGFRKRHGINLGGVSALKGARQKAGSRATVAGFCALLEAILRVWGSVLGLSWA